MRKDIIELKAQEFRQKNGIEMGEPVNIKRLLLKLNVLTVYQPLGDNFSGMCLKQDNDNFMLINSNQPRGRQHFTIGHELFHLFIQKEFRLHMCNPGFLKESQETDADYFSSLLLMPEIGIKLMISEKEIQQKSVSTANVFRLEQLFGVSHLAMVNRLESLKLIDASQSQKLKALPVKRTAQLFGFDISLYNPGNKGLVIGDYGTKAYMLWENDRISEGHYLELMQKIGVDPTAEYNE